MLYSCTHIATVGIEGLNFGKSPLEATQSTLNSSCNDLQTFIVVDKIIAAGR